MNKIALILAAYTDLIGHDLFMARRDFSSLHRRVKGFPLMPVSLSEGTQKSITHAVRVACCFYPKQVLCLQRSAVLVRMLRRNGVPAHMIIGAQKLPFKAHAWVEVNGQVVDDRLASREKFLVLEVC